MKYSIFHETDIERVLKALKDFVTPAFRKYRYVDVVAAGGKFIVVRYKDMAAVIAEENAEAFQPMAVYTVRISKVKGRSFSYGRYAADNDTITIDAEFSEELFHDLLPALLCELTKARILMRDCLLQAENLSKEESRIIVEISRISEEAKEAEVDRLEELTFEVSRLRSDFFRKFMRFKDVVEEAFMSMSAAESIATSAGGLLAEKIDELRSSIEVLHYYESKFQQTLTGVSDALQVVSLRLDMLRNKENLELQKRTSSLQAAAAVIEFVAVYYYTMKIWENFLPVENLPKPLSFTLLAVFTTVVVVYTDAIGDYIRGRKVTPKIVVLTAMLFVTLLLMAALPLLF